MKRGNLFVHHLVLMMVLLPAVALPAAADVVAHFQSDVTLLESLGSGSVTLTIVNTGPHIITTGVVSYTFSAVGGDTTYDAIGQPFDNGACNNSIMLIGVINACVVQTQFPILDHDPFDTLKPPVDTGKWFITATVPWTESTGTTGNAVAGINVAVADDTPEPASVFLLAPALGFLLWRRTVALPICSTRR
jgi:hypothetical protein